jgi:hypothetical protein
MNMDGDLADIDDGEALIGGPYASTCTISTLPVDDPFDDARVGAQADTEFDTQASCDIELDDFGEDVSAFLINVCSYPAQIPGSDPSDCVITPNSGFLTIVKVADPDDPNATFTFNLGAGQESNDGRTSFSIDGSGSEDLIGFDAGTDYDLTEVLPDGWQLDSASCVLSGGASTGTFSGDAVTNFEIQVGRETTCTFNDSLAQGTLTLIKTVINDNGGTLQVADFPLFMNGVSVMSDQQVTFDADTVVTASETPQSGYTASAWGGNCAADGTVTIEAGVDKTCTITNDDQAANLIIIKVVTYDSGGNAVAGDFGGNIGGTATFEGGPSWVGTVAPGQNKTMTTAGDYTVVENPFAGYTTSYSADCTGTIAIGESKTCTVTNDDVPPPDTTKPYCVFREIRKEPRVTVVVDIRDQGSGVAEIRVTKAVNVNVSIDALPGQQAPYFFTPGTNVLLTVFGEKIDQSKSSQLELNVFDAAGNVTVCDPVFTVEIRENGEPVIVTFTELPEAESNITIENYAPGITNLAINVNGKKFQMAGLKDGEVRNIDVSSAMVAGYHNTMTLTASGKPGGSALVVISD